MSILLSSIIFEAKAKFIAAKLGLSSILLKIKNFTGNEALLFSGEEISAQEVSIYYELWPEPNTRLIELLLILDFLREHNILVQNLIVPFIPYLRQDRKLHTTCTIGARMLAREFSFYNVKNIYSLDVHSQKSSDFFSNLTNISAPSLFARKLRKMGNNLGDFIVLSPDQGSHLRAKELASELNIDYYSLEKTRKEDRVYIENNNHIENRNIIMIDDMIDSASTMRAAIESLSQNLEKISPREIYICVSHVLNEASIASLIRDYPESQLLQIDYCDFLDQTSKMILKTSIS